MWGPGDLKGPFLSIVTPIEEKSYSQITYACQDFDSLNHSFNFYWQNNDSKNIHSKKNLIIHSSKIFIQKKTKLFIKKKIHSKKKLSIHSKKIFIQKFFWLFIQWKYSFFWKMPYRLPLGGGVKGFLNNVKKNCGSGGGGHPLYSPKACSGWTLQKIEEYQNLCATQQSYASLNNLARMLMWLIFFTFFSPSWFF